MNWEAFGAVGEVVGAAAVVLTLGILAIQVRHNTRSMNESNRLERVAALDRHSDSIGRWRATVVENNELARIWFAAAAGESMEGVDRLRLSYLWINFVNTQRANYSRAMTVGEAGLARQAALSVAVEVVLSKVFAEEWKVIEPWTALVSEEFVSAITSEIANEAGRSGRYRSSTAL
jgi:hypothetical protein